MKHGKLNSRNFKKKVSRLCKVCQRQCVKGSKFCSTECKERLDKKPSVMTSPMFQTDTAATSTSWYHR